MAKNKSSERKFLSFLDKITIKNRLIMLTSFSSFIVLIFALSVFGMNYHKTLYQERQSLLYNTTKIMSDNINYYVNQAKEGKISKKEAQIKAIEVVNKTSFLNKKGYFFVYNLNGICITVPIKPELAGIDRSQVKDKKGFKYMQKILELAKDNGGYLTYYFDKAGQDKFKTFPKLAYVEPIKEWNWVIGTGDYIDDIQNQVFSVVLNTIVICFVIFLVVVVLLINTIGKSIINPIDKITAISLQLAKNDLNVYIEDDINNTEIGNLNRSFKKFVTNFKGLIQEIYKTVEDISANAEEMSASSEQIAQGSQQTANGTTQLAQGAQEICTNIEQGAITINGMNKIIQRVSAEAKDISKLGNDTEINANKGSSHVHNAIGKIDNIKTVAEDISISVLKLGTLSSEIGTIVDLIKGIASQTNLLALNAAIEAARAGESGKGFAVVAEEVKKLANQSAQATDKINQMIKEIQNETGIAVNKMNKATNEVAEGVTVVNEAGKSLENIIAQVKTANNKIQDITKQIDDVANNSDDIVKMVENISAVTEETAASAQEISSVTEEQTASIQEISASSQILATIAEKLNRQVSIFKI